jgi:uncharacterized protein with von Willebrand factor type A (vWA) domain
LFNLILDAYKSFNMRKGKLKALIWLIFTQTFLGGGTNFALPLDRALKVINESRFKQADVVFVTDGEDRVKTSFLKD